VYPVLWQMNPDHTSRPLSIKSIRISSFYLPIPLASQEIYTSFPSKTFYGRIICPLRATWPVCCTLCCRLQAVLLPGQAERHNFRMYSAAKFDTHKISDIFGNILLFTNSDNSFVATKPKAVLIEIWILYVPAKNLHQYTDGIQSKDVAYRCLSVRYCRCM
jgi:hypothetical protein